MYPKKPAIAVAVGQAIRAYDERHRRRSAEMTNLVTAAFEAWLPELEAAVGPVDRAVCAVAFAAGYKAGGLR